jgi:hypothetical protein
VNIPEYHEVVSNAVKIFHGKVNEAREELDNELTLARSRLFEMQDVTVEEKSYALRSTH